MFILLIISSMANITGCTEYKHSVNVNPWGFIHNLCFHGFHCTNENHVPMVFPMYYYGTIIHCSMYYCSIIHGTIYYLSSVTSAYSLPSFKC